MLVLIGQAPSVRTDKLSAFAGRTGRRLASWMDLTFETFHRDLTLVNVFDDYPGHRNGKGDAFPTAAARERADAILHRYAGRRIVFVGYACASAFNCAHLPPFKWFALQTPVRAYVAKIPHPSGVNTFYNDPANVDRASQFLRAAFQEEVRRAKGQLAHTVSVLPAAGVRARARMDVGAVRS